MNERKVLDYTGWASRIENVGVNTPWSLENLLELDRRILDMQERLQGTDIGSFDYKSLANDMRESMQGIDVLYRYATDTERAIDAMDGRFRTALSKGAVEDLSLIRMDDITVDNTIGMKETYMVGYGDSRCAVERTKDKLTLNDFIGGEGAGCMTEYIKEFADIFRSQYQEEGEESLSEYLEKICTWGEFDHKKYQPVKTFLSDILDVVTLGIKPLLEGLLQYEFITGETLTDTESLFKVVEGLVGLITFGTSAYGKGVAVVAQNLLTEVAANVTAETIVHLGEELGLPPIVIAALELLGGAVVGKTVNGCFVDEDQLLKQIDVEKLQLEGGSDINLTIMSRNASRGNPSAITHFDVDLNARQTNLLQQLSEYDSSIIVNKKDVNLNDLAALTAKTGDEFAMFTRGSQRIIIRGNANSVNINGNMAQELYNAGYRWSGHTHPGTGINVKFASGGDKYILEQFNQTQSVILDSRGNFNVFDIGE